MSSDPPIVRAQSFVWCVHTNVCPRWRWEPAGLWDRFVVAVRPHLRCLDLRLSLAPPPEYPSLPPLLLRYVLGGFVENEPRLPHTHGRGPRGGLPPSPLHTVRFHCCDSTGFSRYVLDTITVDGHRTPEVGSRRGGLRDLEVGVTNVTDENLLLDLLTAIACACGDTLWRLRLLVSGASRSTSSSSSPCNEEEEGTACDYDYRFHVLQRLELEHIPASMHDEMRHHVTNTLGASRCTIVVTPC